MIIAAGRRGDTAAAALRMSPPSSADRTPQRSRAKNAPQIQQPRPLGFAISGSLARDGSSRQEPGSRATPDRQPAADRNPFRRRGRPGPSGRRISSATAGTYSQIAADQRHSHIISDRIAGERNHLIRACSAHRACCRQRRGQSAAATRADRDPWRQRSCAVARRWRRADAELVACDRDGTMSGCDRLGRAIMNDVRRRLDRLQPSVERQGRAGELRRR